MKLFSTSKNVFIAVCVCIVSEAPGALISGQMVPVGDGSEYGPLAPDEIFSEPVGVVSVYGSEQPDLFVCTGTAGIDSGIFLYRWLGTDTTTGAPLFGDRKKTVHPEFAGEVPTYIQVYDFDDVITGVFIDGSDIVLCPFDYDTLTFTETTRVSLSNRVPRNPSSVTIMENADSTYEMILGIGDGLGTTPSDYDRWDIRYRPYDGAGITRGNLSFDYLFGMRMTSLSDPVGLHTIRRISPDEKEVLFLFSGMTEVNLGPGHERDFITGGRMGIFSYFHNTAGSTGATFEPKLFVSDENGLTLRHPNISANPIAYPDAESGLSNLIAGGEGGLSFYQFSGDFNDKGAPIYGESTPVLEQNAKLYTGSLGVTNVADWDGDGADDLVIGNSTGFIQFFRNRTSNSAPEFEVGEIINAGGKPIHLQPGYWLDIQGPSESRWGYICPQVADWNDDGLLDIVSGGSTAQYYYYENVGTATQPELAAGVLIRNEGNVLHGTWRTQPGIAKLNGRTAMVILDDQNEFHLYWFLDGENVEDGGKLLLTDGRTINAGPYQRKSGALGRVKINLTDWDDDGATDLFVATFGRTSIPDPELGLPADVRTTASVLLLRNAGTDAEPRFELPKLFAFEGTPIGRGGHAISADPCHFGPLSAKGIIMSEESGRVFYYHGLQLTLQDWNP